MTGWRLLRRISPIWAVILVVSACHPRPPSIYQDVPGLVEQQPGTVSAVSLADRRSAEQVIQGYFDALSRKDCSAADVFVTEKLGAGDELCKRIKRFDLVSVLAVHQVEPGTVQQVGDDVPTMEFEVVIDVDIEGPTAWAPGHNIRWATVIKTSDGRFLLDSLGSSP